MIAELDGYVGRPLEVLAVAGELEDTVVVYTSDHGEMLGEHGLWFMNILYEDAARVPLLVAGTGLPEGESVETPVSHVDLIATLLEGAGAEPPSPSRGRSLAPRLAGGEGDRPGVASVENHSEGNCAGSFAIREGDWKYVHVTWHDDLLFDLGTDPGERDNRIDDPAAADVRRRLRGHLRDRVDPEAVTGRAFEEQEALRARRAREEGADGLFETLRGRLGDGRVRALADRYGGR